MTKQEQREAIAEFCGQEQIDAVVRGDHYYRPFDCLHDRNAINAVIKDKIVGNSELEKKFLLALDDVIKRPHGTFWKFQMLLITATAAEYCEALLRAIGKWKESQ